MILFGNMDQGRHIGGGKRVAERGRTRTLTVLNIHLLHSTCPMYAHEAGASVSWQDNLTVQGRWQTACMASCGWAVCWYQRCGSSGPWWRWGYGMGKRIVSILWTTKTGAFYWWHFKMHRDTVTRSWGPLLCHSSTTITSCCSMIMHGPMLQGSVHNSWKLKPSQFLHGQHTHRTCHPLSMFGMLWIGVYDSMFQFLSISSNFTQPLDQHTTGHNQQPDQLYVKEMCCTAWGKWWSHQILTGFRTPPIQ